MFLKSILILQIFYRIFTSINMKNSFLKDGTIYIEDNSSSFCIDLNYEVLTNYLNLYYHAKQYVYNSFLIQTYNHFSKKKYNKKNID